MIKRSAAPVYHHFFYDYSVQPNLNTPPAPERLLLSDFDYVE